MIDIHLQRVIENLSYSQFRTYLVPTDLIKTANSSDWGSTLNWRIRAVTPRCSNISTFNRSLIPVVKPDKINGGTGVSPTVAAGATSSNFFPPMTLTPVSSLTANLRIGNLVILVEGITRATKGTSSHFLQSGDRIRRL
jgi:hypothetical protein